MSSVGFIFATFIISPVFAIGTAVWRCLEKYPKVREAYEEANRLLNSNESQINHYYDALWRFSEQKRNWEWHLIEARCFFMQEVCRVPRPRWHGVALPTYEEVSSAYYWVNRMHDEYPQLQLGMFTTASGDDVVCGAWHKDNEEAYALNAAANINGPVTRDIFSRDHRFTLAELHNGADSAPSEMTLAERLRWFHEATSRGTEAVTRQTLEMMSKRPRYVKVA